MIWPVDFINRVICGDCVAVMKLIPDKAIDIVVTDPPWPGHKVKFVVDEYDTFARAAAQIARIARRLVVHLGCDTDPRFLKTVPESMPFIRVCWLRYVPVRYKGNILWGSDVAYVFGEGYLPKGIRVLGGECTHVSRGYRDANEIHPTPRAMDHAKWLIRTFSEKNSIVLDPFAGTGTIAIAAKILGHNFIAIDNVKEYCDNTIEKFKSLPPELFDPPRQPRDAQSYNLVLT